MLSLVCILATNAQVCQQLLQSRQLGCVLNIDEIVNVAIQVATDHRLVAWMVFAQDQSGMVADLLEILQCLEHVGRAGVGTVLLLSLAPGKVLIELSLDRGQVAIVVLGYLGWQVRQHVLLDSTEDEGQGLAVEGLKSKSPRLLFLAAALGIATLDNGSGVFGCELLLRPKIS